MASDKGRRIGTTVGFLAGVIACLDALRDAKANWPPDAVWAQLSHPHRLQFGTGIALILVTLIVSARNWR